MGTSKTVCVFLLGVILVANAQEYSNNLWSVGDDTIEDIDGAEIEAQFDRDWNDLEDPLDWISNVIEPNPPNEYDKNSDHTITDDNVPFESLPGEYEESLETYGESLEDDLDAPSEENIEDVLTEEVTEDNFDEDTDDDDDNDDLDMSVNEETEDDDDDDSDENVRGGRGRHHGKTVVYMGKGKKRGHHKRKQVSKKQWPKRRGHSGRRNRFRNPHGAKEQVPHPPVTGRWQRVWNKFNQSKPAQSGRWASFYNRQSTQRYWNRVRDQMAKRKHHHTHSISRTSTVESGNYSQIWPRNQTVNSGSRNYSQIWRPRNQTESGNYSQWYLRNQTHHWYPRNKTQNWNPRNYTQRQQIWQHPARKQGRKRWLEDKVAHVCSYLSSPRHTRYMNFIARRQRIRGATDRRDYRMDFVSQMSSCCQQGFEERLQCFINLTRARIDEYCSGDRMPFKPWKPGQHIRPVRKLKPKCCLAEGEARYNCFNRTHRLQQYQNTAMSFRQNNTQVTLQGKGNVHGIRPIQPGQKRQLTLKQKVKVKCCNQGKKFAHKVDDRIGEVCNKMSRKVARKAKKYGLICHIAFGKCCINEARKESYEEEEVLLVPEDTDLEEQLDDLEDVNW